MRYNDRNDSAANVSHAHAVISQSVMRSPRPLVHAFDSPSVSGLVFICTIIVTSPLTKGGSPSLVMRIFCELRRGILYLSKFRLFAWYGCQKRFRLNLKPMQGFVQIAFLKGLNCKNWLQIQAAHKFKPQKQGSYNPRLLIPSRVSLR